MAHTILLVEDEPGLVLTLTDLLSGEGYTVEVARDGEIAVEKAVAVKPDVIVLDVMLPRKSGFDVCRELRDQGQQTAILMLTARTQVVDRVQGLKIGADDYLTKPFDPSEFLARIEALLRRTAAQPGNSSRGRFRFADVEIDFDRAEVTKAGEPVYLTGKQLDLLQYLVDHRGQPVSRDELLKKVWDYEDSVTSRTVDVHVALLRQKLETTPQTPRHFHTVRGTGYRFAE